VFEIVDNPLVYRKNQPIADTTIQGALPDEQVFEQISQFVQTKVQERARHDQIIPVSGKVAQIGQVTAGEILTLVRQIRNWGRQVRVVAVAAQDTRRGDTLSLKFQLR